jgi:hypothetical protein
VAKDLESLTYENPNLDGCKCWFLGLGIRFKGSLRELRKCAKGSSIGLQFSERLKFRGAGKPYAGCLKGCEKRAWVVWNLSKRSYLPIKLDRIVG